MTTPALLQRYHIELLLTLSPAELDDAFGDIALVLGPGLAETVTNRERETGLGYYPALDYFDNDPGFDKEILESARHIYYLACDHAECIVRTSLAALTRNLHIESSHAEAETLPHVRPSELHAAHDLGRHYSPNRIRIALTAMLRDQTGDALIARARQAIADKLAEHVAAVEVVNVCAID